MMRSAYRVFSYFGLMSIMASLIYGFRYNANAPASNWLFDVLLYGAWAAVHLITTRPWFKQAAYGSRAGSLIERQVFISVSVITWLLLLWVHRPVPGPEIAVAGPIRFAGTVGVLWAILAFFEGVTFSAIDGLLGVPGSAMSHSHGGETPLLTQGRYAVVRHPQYQAVVLAGLCSLLIHPNVAQLLWCLMIGTTFVLFIPIEEAQLVAARGDAYRTYIQQTPWRLVPGLW